MSAGNTAATDSPPIGLLTFGETMGLISAVGTGFLDYARDFTFSIGGAESNVAIGAARLGAPVTWAGRIGSDAAGDLIERRLRSERINVLTPRDQAFTGLMVRHCRAGSTVHVDYHRTGSAGSRLAPSDLPSALIRRASILHITGITPALSDSARNTVLHAVSTAEAAGVPVSLDINYRSKLWTGHNARPLLRRLVSHANIVFAGVEEAQLVLDTDTDDVVSLAEGLALLGPKEAIIKAGPDGCVASIDGAELVEPAPTVHVVDPVGAGDAFVAGYLAEHMAGAEADQRLRTACAMGAYAVTVPGDCELLPTRRELDALLKPTGDVVR
ncbi:sugar kinase (plasmid) [Embleya sp. NBC_00888]|uniref:sugar kinase n=1 Tax=Embleya sp. NBC_00888 TaxID=2975960 RepID=UPI002F90CC56|nr:sugar kinase [Embleya sp. NBC_00888]